MKLCIAGGRELSPEVGDFLLVLNDAGIALNEITEVVSGKAPGVDTSGEVFADTYNIPVKDFPPDWEKYRHAQGRKNPAGVIRNKTMAEYCDCALVFWDGKSRGTKNMLENMEKLKKPYFLVIVHDDGQRYKAKWFNRKLN